MGLSPAVLQGTLLIPDLLRSAPHLRPVLDRYGLRGCGGPLGPRESLAFFAHAHDVPLDRLLGELRAGLERTPAAEGAVPPAARPVDAIYRPFFKAGIAVVLTLGAAWGAYLLLRIGLEGDFLTVGVHEVNAHGQAQIFGWVGLFVMGFAYQAFPRFKHADLAHPRLAYASLGLMLAGLAARSVCEPLIDAAAWAWAPALAGSLLELAAAALFAWVVLATWRRCGKPLVFYDWYILSALAWFVIQAVYEGVYLAATVAAADRAELLGLVSTWQGPLREIQIHGFALLMILGVSQRLFHHFYGLPAPSPRVSAWALVCLNAAVVGEVAGLVLRGTAGRGWAALWYGSVLLLAASVVWLVRGWRLFSKPGETDRSLKFLRAAYVWLFISLAMLVLLPAYLAAAGLTFSHAYYGAVRHAITVGFVSLMIVGVAAKVVPTLGGVDVRALSPLWAPFVLLNAGCGLRVVGQTLTDVLPASFPVTAASGLLEVAGLALWGLHLWAVMAGRARLRPSAEGGEPATPLAPGEPIVSSSRVGEVLEVYPHLLETFLAFGFKPLGYAALRRTVARRVSIARACRLLAVDERLLLDALNRGRERLAGGRVSLPLVTGERAADRPPGCKDFSATQSANPSEVYP
jgi:hypothetical protein